jgi:hypothetical protein
MVGIIKFRRMKWAGHVESFGEEMCLQLLVLKPKGKRLHGKYRHRWEDNVKIVLQKVV